jgi:hypothetical protein
MRRVQIPPIVVSPYHPTAGPIVPQRAVALGSVTMQPGE